VDTPAGSLVIGGDAVNNALAPPRLSGRSALTLSARVNIM
jgi:hypothetical protein